MTGRQKDMQTNRPLRKWAGFTNGPSNRQTDEGDMIQMCRSVHAGASEMISKKTEYMHSSQSKANAKGQKHIKLWNIMLLKLHPTTAMTLDWQCAKNDKRCVTTHWDFLCHLQNNVHIKLLHKTLFQRGFQTYGSFFPDSKLLFIYKGCVTCQKCFLSITTLL